MVTFTFRQVIMFFANFSYQAWLREVSYEDIIKRNSSGLLVGLVFPNVTSYTFGFQLVNYTIVSFPAYYSTPLVNVH